MNAKLNRRFFMKTGTIACCSLLVHNNLHAMKLFTCTPDQVPDPKKMNYCGYNCSEDCKFLIASIKNDPVLKKEAYDIWEMKERFGVETFEADKIFCFGCKNKDKPEGIRLKKCDVRACAISREYDSCIQCSSLSTCDKNLWKKFPDYHKSFIKLQETYIKAGKI